jgi:hypothetical protein
MYHSISCTQRRLISLSDWCHLLFILDKCWLSLSFIFWFLIYIWLLFLNNCRLFFNKLGSLRLFGQRRIILFARWLIIGSAIKDWFLYAVNQDLSFILDIGKRAVCETFDLLNWCLLGLYSWPLSVCTVYLTFRSWLNQSWRGRHLFHDWCNCRPHYRIWTIFVLFWFQTLCIWYFRVIHI